MIRALAVGAVLLAGTPSAWAQPPLMLAAAQQEARAHAPETAQFTALVQGAEAAAAQAIRRFRQNPEVTGSFGTGAVSGQPEDRSWSIGASWPVDLSGSWRARAASTAADVTHAEQQREDGLRALDERVADAVAEVAYQQRLVARTRDIAQLQQLATTAAHHAFTVGQGSELEADSADLDLAAANVLTMQAQGDLAAARVRLARLLGRAGADDLVVADPQEEPGPGAPQDIDALVDRDPRTQAAMAELVAARSEQILYQRLVRPTPTFGLEFGAQRFDIPAGSFIGTPVGSTLSALWLERELTFSVNVPLPLFDRQQEPRAQATGRVLTAQAVLATTRADVRQELLTAWATLDAASQALAHLVDVPATITRDVAFVQQALATGAFSDVQRTQEVHRLLDTGRIIDTAVRDFRVARAAWVRRAGP